MKKILTITLALLSTLWTLAQDVRTLDTKVADILARMPVYNQKDLNDHMVQMTEIGQEGWDLICSGIVKPGTGDDTRTRFLIESYSRYLSDGKEKGVREKWEAECISYIKSSPDPDVKRFFFNQLKMVGGKSASKFALAYIDKTELAESALAVLTLCGDDSAEKYMSEKLKDKSIKTSVSIMNTLAGIKSGTAVEEFISWYSTGSVTEKTAALNALAASGHPDAWKTLMTAAKEAGFLWEPTSSVEALLDYAKALAERGNVKKANKICKLVLKSTNDNSIQFKSYALALMVKLNPEEASDILPGNFEDKNLQYRMHALRLAISIDGEKASRDYLAALQKAGQEYKPDIIHMLAERRDKIALPLIKDYLNDGNSNTRMAALEALTLIEGNDAADDLISYMHANNDIREQEKAFSLYSTIADKERLAIMAEAYPESGEITKAFALMLLAEGGDNSYFDLVFSETGSDSELVRNAAYVSLKNLAVEKNIPALLDLLALTREKSEIQQVQAALITAANTIADPELRAEQLISAGAKEDLTVKIIPVLPGVGGRNALKLVLDNFYNGNQHLKETSFDALAGWKDYSASYALFDICGSDQKSYLKPAFEGYIRQVGNAGITKEQKLLLLRKIMVFAETPDLKVKVLSNISDIRTLQALLFAAEYFDDNVINQVAIRSAVQIALPSSDGTPGLYGSNVRVVLEEATGLLKGQGSDYEKERISSYLEEMPADEGYVPMFNAKDLSGWQGLVENPVSRAKMSRSELARKQAEADKKMTDNWSVKDGAIWFSGKGANLCSVKDYADFDMLVDWRITKKGDSGIYLRGSPQIQIWDTSRVEVGAQVGSGGLYNNSINESDPLKIVDNPVGDWNTFRIIMIGERVSVWLNGELVVDDVIMENYWDRSIPIFPKGAIELQAHGNELAFRDIYVREIKKENNVLSDEEINDGFVLLFNGEDLDNWTGDKESYVVRNNEITIIPDHGASGNLFTEKEYSDFILRFEFKLTPGANNGLGIRSPLTGNPAYKAMELQIIDNTTNVFGKLKDWQYHASIYGVSPAKRGFQSPLGEWNTQEVVAKGNKIKVTLNGEIILDDDISDYILNSTIDGQKHPGLKNEIGHIGFLGHGSVVYFRNIRIKELD